MFQVAGAVRIDLRIEEEENWRPWLGKAYDDGAVSSAMQQAVFAPPGAEVVFVVGRRQFPPSTALAILRDEGQHLGRITVECDDADTVKSWAKALRGEDALI